MKNLLKLLAVFTISIPVSLNVVAYGSSSDGGDKPEPTPTPSVDITSLLEQAKEKIQSEIGKLIDEYDNLTYENQFSEGKKLEEAIKNTTVNEQIKDEDVRTNFLELITKDINQKIIPALKEEQSLAILFNGITDAELLKIDISQTILTKKEFEWSAQDGRFGIQDYNPTDFDTTYWYEIGAELNLNLSYKNDENKKIIYNFNQNYNSYFANAGAKIQKIIELVTTNITNKFKNYLVKIKEDKTFDTGYWWEDRNLEQKIKENITLKINDTKATINASSLDYSNENISMTKGYFLYRNKLLEKSSSEAKTLFTTFANENLTSFQNYLETWSGKSKIDQSDLDKVTLAGDYQIKDWSYDGLTLKPENVSTIVVETENRAEKIQKTAEKIGKIYSKEGILNNRISVPHRNAFTMKMNSTDFNSYVDNNKPFGDTVKYLSDKTKKLAINDSIINADDYFLIKNFYSDNTNFTNVPLKDKLNDDRTKSILTNLPSEGSNAVHLHLRINGYALEFGWNFKSYTVEKGTDDKIWPTIKGEN